MSIRTVSVIPGKPESATAEERPDVDAADGGVLVDGLLMGVCGTDIEIATAGYGWAPAGRERLVLGHESLGRVVEAPAGSGFATGDLVAGIVRRPDPVPCRYCADGAWDMCSNGQYTERGIKDRDGYGASQWRCEPNYLIKLDPALGDLGVLLEPTSVVAKAWDQILRIGARAPFHPRVALVTGAGPIGLLAALIGVQHGYEVHVVDQVTTGPKPDLVADLGARYHSQPLDALDLTPDIVIEGTGVGSLVFDVLEHSGPNAIVCLAGISSGTREIGLSGDSLNKRMVLTNEVVFGSVNAGRAHYQSAADALARADRSWLARLVSRRVPLSRWSEVLTRQPDDVKVTIDLQA